MDKLKFSILDLFGYVFPGLLTLVAMVVVFDKSIVRVSDLSPVFSHIDLSKGLALIVAAFIIGFAIDHLGTWMFDLYNLVFKKIGDRTIPRDSDTMSKLSMKELRVIAREHCPQNFYWLQLWKVFKTMGHNFAAAALLVICATMVKIVQLPKSAGVEGWIGLAVGMIIFALLFLQRARIFDQWHYQELAIAVKTLNLEAKAKKI